MTSMNVAMFQKLSPKTREEIRKAIENLAPHTAKLHVPDTLVSVDDLRHACLTFERCNELLTGAERFIANLDRERRS
jgi:hypothetical protein